MRIFVSGATGFIGRALVPLLQRYGHTVVVLARSEIRARNLLGADVSIIPTTHDLSTLATAISGCDAVVNLAGAPLVGKRWTAARRRVLEESRIGVTEQLVRAIEAASPRPSVFIAGSAVGYYGDRANEELIESSASTDDFLSRLCQKWEAAAIKAKSLGVRVVNLRTGVVLGRAGGALAQMLPPFQMGVGGPLGSGRQYFPWIHLHDLVKIIVHALTDDRFVGPVNAVAPQQTTNREFTRLLGRALKRPAFLPLPAFVLQIIFGQASVVLLGSQRVVPAFLMSQAFTWDFPALSDALEDVLIGTKVTIRTILSPPADAIGARYELIMTTVVDTPTTEAFAFFSKPDNLGLLTPATMKFSSKGKSPTVAANTLLEHQLRIAMIPLRWRSRIVTWEPGRRFVDRQELGPYRLWWHEHTFSADGERTIMGDRVCYTPPLGLIGRMVHQIFIAGMLRQIFQYRSDVIRLRFGDVPSNPSE